MGLKQKYKTLTLALMYSVHRYTHVQMNMYTDAEFITMFRFCQDWLWSKLFATVCTMFNVKYYLNIILAININLKKECL